MNKRRGGCLCGAVRYEGDSGSRVALEFCEACCTPLFHRTASL